METTTSNTLQDGLSEDVIINLIAEGSSNQREESSDVSYALTRFAKPLHFKHAHLSVVGGFATLETHNITTEEPVTYVLSVADVGVISHEPEARNRKVELLLGRNSLGEEVKKLLNKGG
jgi:hypothetical protein